MKNNNLIELKFPKKCVTFNKATKRKKFKTIAASVEFSKYNEILSFAKSKNITINELIKTLLIEFIKENTKKEDNNNEN